MIADWHSGTPSIKEWNGSWRANDFENEVSQEEWQSVWKSLDRFLSESGKNGFDDDSDFFLRSTWFENHRTQVIELVNPNALTLDFLKRMQIWLKENHPTWRVIVPLFLGETNVLVVYPNVIRGGDEFESDWESGLECARRAMLKLKQFEHINLKS